MKERRNGHEKGETEKKRFLVCLKLRGKKWRMEMGGNSKVSNRKTEGKGFWFV